MADTADINGGTVDGAIIGGSSAAAITGTVITGSSLDISGNADIDGILEADAITVNGTSLAETISDTVGAMFSSNTETGISITYDDSNNTLDAVVTLSPFDTDNLSEGSSNLYYTNTRVRSHITGSDLDMGGNKVLFGNVYSNESDLPSASTYHGMFAHVHATQKGYFAHGGAWHKLLDESSSTTSDLTEGTNKYYTDERVDDRVNALLQAGTNMTLTYNDAANTLTVATDGKSTEEIQDIVGAMVSSNTESGISVTYEDSDGTLDFNVNDPTLTFTGDVNGSGTVTNLGNTSIALTVGANSVALSTDTTGDYVDSLVAGTGVTLSNNSGEGATPTVAIGQSVGTSDNVTFADVAATGNVTVSGNLYVYCSTTTISTSTLDV